MRPKPTTSPICALALLLAALVLSGVAQAQVLPKITAELEGAKRTIEGVEQRLGRHGIDDALLQQLRSEMDPVAAKMNAVAAELSPRIAAVQDRLAQLGPKPDGKGASEAAAVTQERDAQQTLFDDLDSAVKRAKVLAVQANQVGDTIAGRRRAMFTHDLFARSSSLLSPHLWIAVAAEAPDDAVQFATLAQSWGMAALDRLEGWRRPTLAALLALIAVAYLPSWRLAVRARSRSPDLQPTRLRKGTAALRVVVATAAVPILSVLAVGAVVTVFDLPNLLQSIGEAATAAVVAVAVGTGLSRGLFAPKSPNWRLPPIDDLTAKSLYHLTISTTSVAGAEHVAGAVAEFVRAGLSVTIAIQGLGALAVVALVGRTLRRTWLRRARHEGPVRSAQNEHLAALLRLAGRASALVLLVALIVGFVAFATFLVDQLIVVAGTLALLYLLLIVTEEGFASALDPGTLLGRSLTALFGLRPDALAQIAVLLSGLVRVSLYVAALLLVLAPWRIESGDLLATLQAAFFGFSLGGVTVSLSALLVSILLFALVLGATRGLQRWLETKYLPHTKLDTGLHNSIKTSLGYVGFVVALGLALAYLGLSWERLTLIAGGLSLGIGLGLQTVTNNFVSGLILLWERAVRVGDWVEVGAEQGFVRRINVRSTEIETFDRALVIMPNANLVGGQVKNWVRNDRVGRVKLGFTLPVTADPEEVRSALLSTAKAHDRILAIPTPAVLFTGIGEASMTFDLICFVDDVESRLRVSSDLLYEIHGKLRALGYIAPAAAPVVTSPVLDKLDAWLDSKVSDARDAGIGKAAAE